MRHWNIWMCQNKIVSFLIFDISLGVSFVNLFPSKYSHIRYAYIRYGKKTAKLLIVFLSYSNINIRSIIVDPPGYWTERSCKYSFLFMKTCNCWKWLDDYLVDPASSHTLVLKIKPCMSKCFDDFILDCRRLNTTVIVLFILSHRWIPVEILELIHAKHLYAKYRRLLTFSNQSDLLHYGWNILLLENHGKRDKSIKFLTYQLVSSVLDYWGIDG